MAAACGVTGPADGDTADADEGRSLDHRRCRVSAGAVARDLIADQDDGRSREPNEALAAAEQGAAGAVEALARDAGHRRHTWLMSKEPVSIRTEPGAVILRCWVVSSTRRPR